jgi:hypothetical protein
MTQDTQRSAKHFLMVLNYIKEQIASGQIEARKIYGKLNNADKHTKPLRSSDFAKMAHKILGQPAPPPVTTPTSPTTLPAENKSVSDLGVDGQPSNERKRLWLPAATKISAGTKGASRSICASDSTMDADVKVPAV